MTEIEPQSTCTEATPPAQNLSLFVGVLVAGVVADLVTKWLVFERFQVGFHREGSMLYAIGPDGRSLEAVPIISGLFSIRPSINTGAVFGSLAGQIGLLSILSVVALVVIFVILFRAPERPVLFQISMGLISAGALGNLWDRLKIGGVRDFLDFYIRDWHWPTFNIADSCICVGVGLFLLLEFLRPAPARG